MRGADLFDPWSPYAWAARDRRLRDLHDHCTCPRCGMHWSPSADSAGAAARDFAGTVVCPDCYMPSRANPHLDTPLRNDGRRVPIEGRGSR